MGDLLKLFVVFLVLVVMAYFVRRKSKAAGSFGKWLWMAMFGAISAFLVYAIFITLIHMDSWIIKQLTMFLALAIVTPTAGHLGGLLYDRKRGS